MNIKIYMKNIDCNLFFKLNNLIFDLSARLYCKIAYLIKIYQLRIYNFIYTDYILNYNISNIQYTYINVCYIILKFQ